jgi:asparagine synthase (glutamine-hydrolysing)
MCGIAGFLHVGSFERGKAGACALAMANALIHRGPDDGGVWVDPEAGVALSHRRLAILELSPAGHQPMISSCGRYALVFNGEIYNHLEIRSALGAVAWRGHSDTETLLEGIAFWGVEATLRRCSGMFAFAIWDRQRRTLTLARDRMGEKPLYLGWHKDNLLFASELKALEAHPEFSGEVDRSALTALLKYNCIPAPLSIYKGIAKLPPGTVVTVSADDRSITPLPYWSMHEVVGEARVNGFLGEVDRAIVELESVLVAAISRQMVADVPVGAFLSGGIDSSLVVALMRLATKSPVKTFSIGFEEAGFDESAYARAVASHLRTEHTELYVTARSAQELIPELPGVYDEPFADSSQIPTILVSRLARSEVKVALSGDGGDELFGGYNRYVRGPGVLRTMSRLPLSLRRMAGAGFRAIPAGLLNLIGNASGRAEFADKCRKLSDCAAASDILDMYRILRTQWRDSDNVVLDATPWQDPRITGASAIEGSSERLLMYLDAISYLPDDILAKVDRAAMSCGLETRVPFLDPTVVGFSWTLPTSFLITNGVSKWILRQVLYRHVPPHLVNRPKSGFAVPVGSWLRGPLREWAHDLLEESRLRDEGFFNAPVVRQRWKEHLSGQRDWQHHLWSVLMFQAWRVARGA